jgi:hypothetical protein
MATKLKREKKRGMKLEKKSSPLKLLSQSQPNFAEMILGWPPSKLVSGISYLRPRCRGEDFLSNFIPLFFSIFSLVAILVGSRDHRTQLWKGAIQRSFHHSLVAIGPVVSEEKIFM